ncbi:hypothetical protein [Geotalea toluenoxydans]|uniref:hypothetical protein n=1 Tax=Geotalea toluenoxydans TaxID=421624 RepID=UPI000A570C74|nr:hypothetical protein [Geotalea toluenoxydans]
MAATTAKRSLNYLRATFTVLLVIYGFICARSAEEGSFLDRVDLIAHEAGHLLFGYFGEFLMVIGGTLGQLLVPVGIGSYFIRKREFFSATVILFWLGQNMFNMSVYIKDAAVMELPLVNIGGGEGIHDWNWLLLKFNILAYDKTIGNAVHGLGVLIIAVSILLGFYFSFKNEEIPEE